jgi:hypothetical protein
MSYFFLTCGVPLFAVAPSCLLFLHGPLAGFRRSPPSARKKETTKLVAAAAIGAVVKCMTPL